MSLIGPRPLGEDYLIKYSKTQIKRHNILPGITGLAQVHGRNELTFSKSFQYDLYYLRKSNFCLDLKILTRSIYIIVKNFTLKLKIRKSFDGSN